MKLWRQLLTVALATGIGGCATSSPHTAYTSTYVVAHGGNGADMDALLLKELTRQGRHIGFGLTNPSSNLGTLTI
jgi:hypothetical protein